MVRAIIGALAAGALVTSAHAASELKIGFLSTLSGPGGGIGIEVRDGFNLAVKLAGGRLGGLPTEIVFADDQLNPEVGKQHAERLLKRDRVNLMTGVIFSNVMLAVWPTIEQSKIFYVAPNYPAGKDALTGFKRGYKGKIVNEVYTKVNQLDYSAELAQIRAAKPDTLYAFLPGGMGINFLKQFGASGLSKEIQLVVPGFVSDQDIIPAVGEPMLGLFDTSHWAYDLDNDANRKFVAEFEKEYKRLPSLFAEQGYTTALIIDAAVKEAKGKVEDEKTFRAALMRAPTQVKTPRGDWKAAPNGTPIQDYYVRQIVKDDKGRIVNKRIGTVLIFLLTMRPCLSLTSART